MPHSTRAIGERMRNTLLLVSCTLALVACAGKQPPYVKDSFSVDSRYQRKFRVDKTVACDAARRALLGDGYNIASAANDDVKGRKAYRSEGDRSTFVEMNIVCAADPEGSTLYANGVLSTYDVKKSGGSASVGLSALGSVSLPFGQSADSMVKTSDQTITDGELYKRFFSAVEGVLTEIQPADTTSEATAAKPAGAAAPDRKASTTTPKSTEPTTPPTIPATSEPPVSEAKTLTTDAKQATGTKPATEPKPAPETQ